MSIVRLVRILNENGVTAKLVFDFKSQFVQISTQTNETVWSGRLSDLTEEEVYYELLSELE